MSRKAEQEATKQHIKERAAQREQRQKDYEETRYKETLVCDLHPYIDINCKICVTNIRTRVKS